MRFAVKEYKRNTKVLSSIIHVRTAGWSPISASSRPPYGPHIESHEAEVYYGSISQLENIRVISPDVDAQLGYLERQIEKFKQQHQQLLNENFLTFNLAKVTDFDPAVVTKGYTKAEAQAKLPKGQDAEECSKRGKQLAGIAREFSSILK
mgnify:CR=1 FL=1